MRKLLFLLLIFNVSLLQAQTYFLNGDAVSLGDDCYKLTGEFPNQNGTVWYADQIDLTQPLDIQFIMNFGQLDGTGADGICFVLQTVGTSAIGQSGGGMGYLNFGTSLGIEFDTWQNGEYGDPVEDHIAIEINGDINHTGAGNIAGPVQADALDANIEDTEDHIVRIVWDPTQQIVQVYFDCVFRLSGQLDLINDVFGGQNLVYWGFTAATGGSYNNQIVCLQESIINQTEELTICTGASTTLVAGASSDGIYTWTPETYLDDPTSGSPVCSAPVPTSYTVSFNDLCNVPTELHFNVDVQDLAVTTANIETINCGNNSSTIDALLNLDLSANYTWSLNGTVLAQAPNLDAFTATTPGSYLVEVNVQDACFAETVFNVPSDFTVYQTDAGEDQTINCNSDAVILSGSYNGTTGTIAWEFNGQPIPGENGLTLSADQPGTYTFTVVHPTSLCEGGDNVVVDVDVVAPEVTIGDQDSLTCTFPVIYIHNVDIICEHDYVVYWSTTNGNIVSGQNAMIAYVDAPGMYTITVKDNVNGCTTTANVYIGVAANFDIDLSSLTFPNVISSNGDSKNEKWLPFLKNDPGANLGSIFGEYELQIFDRWGNLIFESKSYNSAWTGKEEETGTYYYLLHYKTLCDQGKSDDVKGFVELLR